MFVVNLPSVSLPSVKMAGQASSKNPSKNSYIKDGLVFHLDGINKGPNEGAWTDLVGGVVFENHGAVSVYDGWMFNNSANTLSSYMIAGEPLNFPADTHTLEVCVIDNTNGLNTYCYFSTNTPNSLLAARNVEQDILYNSLASSYVFSTGYNYTKGLNRVSFAKDLCIINGVATRANVTTAINFIEANAVIGGMVSSNPPKGINGKIYSIRVYDRLLTEEEMRHNQEVDYKRFDLGNIGKTIYLTSTSDSVDLTINNVKKAYSVKPNKQTKIVVDEVVTLLSDFIARQPITEIDLSCLDTSNVNDITAAFKNSQLNFINLQNAGISKIRGCHSVFTNSGEIKSIDATGIDVSNSSMFYWTFRGCSKLKSLDISNWNFRHTTNLDSLIALDYALEDLKFGYNYNKNLYIQWSPLTHESALSVIDGLAEVTTPQVVTFKTSTYNTLTEEDIAKATSKGWTIVSAN